MAINNETSLAARKLIGTELIEIQKINTQVQLIFRDRRVNTKIALAFRGLLFESISSVLNKKVQNIEIKYTLGFKALTQLRFLNEDVSHYGELLIQMKGHTEEFKMELICVSTEFKFRKLRKQFEKNK
jgi:hypothetical protein